MTEVRELLASFRLASPALPIGGFSYSQGLETAIDLGWVRDERSALDWISGCLNLNIGGFESPMLSAMIDSLEANEIPKLVELNDWYLASRESRELRAETLQMGYSMFKLLQDDLQSPDSRLHARWVDMSALIDPEEQLSLPLSWAFAAVSFGVSSVPAVASYLWAWAENQVMAAMKCIPLGQQSGQRMLLSLIPVLDHATRQARALPQDQWANGANGFAMASCWHESQYSRMFRS